MKLVAVTACPTGIAHSQMAAENLEQTADELGHEIRVEIQGAMGAEDELTADEIADADAVIIAADTSVKRDRFESKVVVKGTVKDAVNDAEGLIQQARERVSPEADEGGGDAAAGSEAAASADAGSVDGGAADSRTDESGEAAQQEGTRRRGGDRSKGLFARLKRLFS